MEPPVALVESWYTRGFSLPTQPVSSLYIGELPAPAGSLRLDVSKKSYDQIFLAYSVSKYLDKCGIPTILGHDAIFLEPYFKKIDISAAGQSCVSTPMIIERKSKCLFIGTDGGATGNGTTTCVASWATVVRVENAPDFIMSGVITVGATNNIGELTAIKAAVDYAAQNTQSGDKVTIISDSMYSINSIEVWYKEWTRKRILAQKKNTDIIGKIVDTVDGLRKQNVLIIFTHQKSHKTNNGTKYWELNDLADKECTRLLEPYRNKVIGG